MAYVHRNGNSGQTSEEVPALRLVHWCVHTSHQCRQTEGGSIWSQYRTWHTVFIWIYCVPFSAEFSLSSWVCTIELGSLTTASNHLKSTSRPLQFTCVLDSSKYGILYIHCYICFYLLFKLKCSVCWIISCELNLKFCKSSSSAFSSQSRTCPQPTDAKPSCLLMPFVVTTISCWYHLISVSNTRSCVFLDLMAFSTPSHIFITRASPHLGW